MRESDDVALVRVRADAYVDIGRPSKAEPFRSLLVGELAKQSDVLAVELLRRAQLVGYAGAKSAIDGRRLGRRHDVTVAQDPQGDVWEISRRWRSSC